jgi:hypothetical protein
MSHFFAMFNPILGFNSAAAIMSMQKEINEQIDKEEKAFAETGSRKLSLSIGEINELKRKKYICDGSIHPDTKEVIAYPMRMAAFVPANLPIIAGIMLAP